jgi:hypothetical protein
MFMLVLIFFAGLNFFYRFCYHPNLVSVTRLVFFRGVPNGVLHDVCQLAPRSIFHTWIFGALKENAARDGLRQNLGVFFSRV